MSVLGIALSLILVVLAALHALWGVRIWWPADNEVRLARMVVGVADSVNMPTPLACFAVTTALPGVAFLILLSGVSI